MKKILILLFSLLISFNSYAEWQYISENTDGGRFYADIDNFREHNGYIYYWILGDYLLPMGGEVMSANYYFQGDCNLMRFKNLSFIHYNQPMGNGVIRTSTPPNPQWDYAGPESVNYIALNLVCKYLK